MASRRNRKKPANRQQLQQAKPNQQPGMSQEKPPDKQPQQVATPIQKNERSFKTDWGNITVVLVACFVTCWVTWWVATKDKADLVATGTTHPYESIEIIRQAAQDTPPVGFSLLDSHYRSYTVISITNTGNDPAEDVNVNIPDSLGHAYLERMGGKTELQSFQNRVPVGEIGVQETVTLKIWTKFPVSEDRWQVPYKGNADAYVALRKIKPGETFLDMLTDTMVTAIVSSFLGIVVALAMLRKSLNENTSKLEQLEQATEESEAHRSKDEQTLEQQIADLRTIVASMNTPKQ